MMGARNDIAQLIPKVEDPATRANLDAALRAVHSKAVAPDIARRDTTGDDAAMKRGAHPTTRYVKTDDGIHIGYQVFGEARSAA